MYHLFASSSNAKITLYFFFLSRANRSGIGIVVSKLEPLLYSFLLNSAILLIFILNKILIYKFAVFAYTTRRISYLFYYLFKYLFILTVFLSQIKRQFYILDK